MAFGYRRVYWSSTTCSRLSLFSILLAISLSIERFSFSWTQKQFNNWYSLKSDEFSLEKTLKFWDQAFPKKLQEASPTHWGLWLENFQALGKEIQK